MSFEFDRVKSHGYCTVNNTKQYSSNEAQWQKYCKENHLVRLQMRGYLKEMWICELWKQDDNPINEEDIKFFLLLGRHMYYWNYYAKSVELDIKDARTVMSKLVAHFS